MDLPEAGKRRLRATGYQNLLFGTFTRGKPRVIIPKVRSNNNFLPRIISAGWANKFRKIPCNPFCGKFLINSEHSFLKS